MFLSLNISIVNGLGVLWFPVFISNLELDLTDYLVPATVPNAPSEAPPQGIGTQYFLSAYLHWQWFRGAVISSFRLKSNTGTWPHRLSCSSYHPTKCPIRSPTSRYTTFFLCIVQLSMV
jgi:hypothetical protein